MRRSSEKAAPGGAASVRHLLAGAMTATALIMTTTTVALQDVGALTGVEAKQSERWSMRLNSLPIQTVARATSENAPEIDTMTTGSIKTSRVVRTSRNARIVGLPNSEERLKNRAAAMKVTKGGRVTAFNTERFNTGKTAPAMLQSHSLLLKDGLRSKVVSQYGAHMQAMARKFYHSNNLATAGGTKVVAMQSGILRITQPQTLLAEKKEPAAKPQVIKTARLEIKKKKPKRVRLKTRKRKVIAKPKRRAPTAASSVSYPAKGTFITAYAPQPSIERENPFNAVLRPTLPKERPIIGSLKKVLNKFKIKLGRHDHKWALNPLPRNSYSASQRRCLAVGVYFEARGEPLKGQRAVAQVILNRVKNPAYPRTVCGVVYQNKYKRNRCQFSFACDGIRDRIKSKKHWQVARKVANDAIDGKVWLRKVGSSSHYHADYVRPRWRRSMKRLTKIGRHIFYRTYRGGWS